MRYSLNTVKRKRTLSGWPAMFTTFSICLLCWGAGCIFSTGIPLAADSVVLPFWDIVCAWLDNRYTGYLFGFLLMLLTAFIIQRISDIEVLISERTQLVFLFFVLLTSTNVALLPFGSVTIVLLCLVFMINELFTAYQLPDATGKMFNAGVLLGVAGLFMPQVLWFLPLLWIGMYQFLSLNYRSFMASLIGVMIIYWFVLAWCVWRSDFSMFSAMYVSLADFEFLGFVRPFLLYKAGFAGIILFLIPVLFHVKSDAVNNRIRVRKILSFLLNMSIWSLILTCLYGGSADSFLAILYLPASVLNAYFFENMNNRFRLWLYYFILALCVFSFVTRLWNF